MMKVFAAIILTVGCCSTLINSQYSSMVGGEKVRQDLYVLTVLPYVVPGSFFQPSSPVGPAVYVAIELAAEMLNNRTDILYGYQLKLLRENGGCQTPFRALEGLVRGLSLGKDDPAVVGMIGPGCSISSTSVAAFNGRKEVSLLNIHFGGTTVINNRMKYPFSFGGIDSVDILAQTLVALIKDQSWKNISVFYEESRLYFSSLSRSFNRELQTYNDELVKEGNSKVYIKQRDVLPNNPFPVRSVQNTNRIVIFMVEEDLLEEMLCVLHYSGIKFPNYLFVLAGFEAFNPSKVMLTLHTQNLTCTEDIIEEILATSVLLGYQLEASDEKEIKYSGISLERFKEIYSQRIWEVNQATNASILPSREGALYFDALWSLALVLNNSMDRVDISTYQFLDHQEDTKIIRDELVKLDYEGLSGRITFNNKTGRVKQNVSISLIKKSREVKLAYYTKITNNITVIRQENYTNTLISDKFERKRKTIPQALLYLILIFAAVSAVMITTIHILTFVYRERQSVKASSIKLNQLAFISCYMFVVVILLNILIHGFHGFLGEMSVMFTGILQHILDVFLSVGLTLLFGTACLRTWRLYRIFVHYKKPGKLLSDNSLLGVLGAVVLVDLFLVVPPIFIDQYKADFKYITSKKNTDAVLTVIMVCSRKNFYVWFFCSLVVSIVLMIIILILTIQTRKISLKNFKTKMTVFQLYLLTIILPTFLGLYLVFNLRLTYSSIIAQFVFLSVLMLSLIFISNLMLFLPPLLPVLQESRFCSKFCSKWWRTQNLNS